MRRNWGVQKDEYLLDDDDDDDDEISTSSDPGDCKWIILAGIFFVELIFSSIPASFGLLLVSMVQETDADIRQTFWTPVVFTASWCFADPFWRRWISESRHRSRLLAVLGVLITSSGIAVSTATRVPILSIMFYGILGGIGSSMVTLHTELTLIGHYPARSSSVFAQFVPRLSKALAQFAAPLIMLGFISSYGARTAPLLQAGLVLQSLLGAVILSPPREQSQFQSRPRAFTFIDHENQSISSRDSYIQSRILCNGSHLSATQIWQKPSTSPENNHYQSSGRDCFETKQPTIKYSKSYFVVDVLPKILEESEGESDSDSSMNVNQSDLSTTTRSMTLPVCESDFDSSMNVNHSDLPLTARSMMTLPVCESDCDSSKNLNQSDLSAATRSMLNLPVCNGDTVATDKRWSIGTIKEIQEKYFIENRLAENLKKNVQFSSGEVCGNESVYSSKYEETNTFSLDSNKLNSKLLGIPGALGLYDTEFFTKSLSDFDNYFSKSVKNSHSRKLNNLTAVEEQYHSTVEVYDAGMRETGASVCESSGTLKKSGHSILDEKEKEEFSQDTSIKINNDISHIANQSHVPKQPSAGLEEEKDDLKLSEEITVKEKFTLDLQDVSLQRSPDDEPESPCSGGSDQPLCSQSRSPKLVFDIESVQECSSRREAQSCYPVMTLFCKILKQSVTCACVHRKKYSHNRFESFACSYLDIIRTPYFFPSALMHFVLRLCPMGFATLAPSLMKSRVDGCTNGEAAFAVSISGFVWLCYLLVTPWCTKTRRDKQKYIFTAGNLVAAYGLHALSSAESRDGISLNCAIYGLGLGVTSVNGSEMMQDVLGAWNFIRVNSSLNTISTVLTLAAGFIMDYIMKDQRSLPNCFTFMAILYLVSGIIWFITPFLGNLHCHHHHHHHHTYNSGGHLLSCG